MKINIVKLGEMDYPTALELQVKLVKLRQLGRIEDILLLLEHPPVITVGTSGKDSNILISEESLKSNGINVYRTNRGGDVTYHGPGQIVGYPILDLNCHGKDLHLYVRRLEEVIIRLLQEEYGIISERKPGYPGVWVNNDKITALGTAVKSWVTMHGFAFNVNTNLEHFRWITPCGLVDKGVTSVQKILGSPQEIDLTFQYIVKHFSNVFTAQPFMIDKEIFLKEIEELSHESKETGLA